MPGTHRKNTIKKEVFQSSMLHSLMLLVCMAGLMGVLLFDSEEDKLEQVLKLHNESTNHIIEGHFAEVSNIVESLAETNYVRNAAINEDIDHTKLLNYYQTISNANKKITHLYSAYANNLLFINNYSPPSDYSTTARPWFQYAVKHAPQVSTGLPYQDAVNKRWLISTGKAFKDNNGQYGVVAIDSALSVLTSLLNQKAARYNTSKSFITDLDGTIIIHPEADKINQPLSCEHNHRLWLSEDNGQLNYKENNTHKIAYYSRISETGWLLFTEINRSEIVTPILSQVVLNVSLLAIIALIATFIYSTLLSHSLSSPMVRLKEHVQQITKGKVPAESSLKFPDNEIGAVAKDVIQLTKKALYKRTQALAKANKRIDAINQQLAQKNQALRNLAERDQLTNLYNRRKLNEVLQSEQNRFERYQTPFCIIMLDIDHFKHINDNYGHHAGDQVLKLLSEALSSHLRNTDVLGRWGGEEFLLICPQMTLPNAKQLAEKLRLLIAGQVLAIEQQVTVSLGVTEFRTGDSISSALTRADSCLYDAKNGGRNQYVAE